MLQFDDKTPESLNDRIRVDVQHGPGSRKNERLINFNVSPDVLKSFIHLSNLKRVETYTVDRYILTFDSKMNLE